jgi:hypothetical protein
MNDYLAIKELSRIIGNDVLCEVKNDRISRKIYELSISKRINEYSNYLFRVRFELDVDLLWKEYGLLAEPKKHSSDFSNNEAVIKAFIERKYVEIMGNLSAFNPEMREDNYVEIAKLVDETFGTSIGKKFGL